MIRSISSRLVNSIQSINIRRITVPQACSFYLSSKWPPSRNCQTYPNTRALHYSNRFRSAQRDGAKQSNIVINSCDEKKTLSIYWNKHSYEFPFVWLRDICQCSSCFNSTVQSRITDFTLIDPEVHPTNIGTYIQSNGDYTIKISWSDDHKSEFNLNYLKQFKFHASEEDQTFDRNVRYWGADVEETQLKFFDFGELIENDRVLHDWLVEIQELGLTVVKNAPQDVGQLHRIGERIAFLRPCNYGPTFQVKSKVDASNAAYTSGSLPLHTDLAYYIWAPGVQLLHCITQSGCSGGENLLADGFRAAEELREEDPDAFNLLTTSLLEYYDVGTDYVGQYHQYARHPVIRLDDNAKVNGVYWSDHGRHPMLRIPPQDVQPLYKAMKAWHSKLYLPENLFRYKMENGDILCFNNKRTLHGRAAYTASASSNRHLEGSYLEWDELNSKLRVLKATLKGMT